MARIVRICKKCRKTFLTRNPASNECYMCTLDEISHNHFPQEDDYDAALLTSGETIDSQFANLKSKLEVS